jgi:hypothetical protein
VPSARIILCEVRFSGCSVVLDFDKAPNNTKCTTSPDYLILIIFTAKPLIMNPTFKKYLPHIIALLSFLAVSFIYFNDVVSGGKQIKQHDIKMYEGGAAEAAKYSKATGETIFFTESMFSGMPMYLINMPYYGNIIYHKLSGIYNLFLPYPVNQLFILMLGFYILLLTFRLNPYLAIGGAIAFALSSNNMVFTAAGHATKVNAIAYVPLVLAGFHMTVRGNKWLGATITAIGLSFQMGANHFQITYYMFFIMAAWYIAEVVGLFMKKDGTRNINDMIVRSLILLVAAGLGLATGLSSVMVSKEYGDYSIRGKSELTLNKTDEQKAETGLERTYTFEYSYSGIEPLTILIPNLYGGAEQAPFDKNSETYKLLSGQQNPKELTSYLLGYWGNLRITAGPPYFGAIIIMLFVLGCIMVRSPLKWALVATTLLSVALAYGRNFESFNYWMFDHFPYYNKFRAVTTALVIAQVCIPILAFLGLKAFIDAIGRKEDVMKKLYIAVGITAGLCFIFVLAPGSTVDFTADKYKQVFGEKGIPPQYEEAMLTDCKNIVRMDAMRSLFFILVAGGALYAFAKNKLRLEFVAGLLAIAVLVDMFVVDRRYLGDDQLERKKKAGTEAFAKTAADEFILKDNTNGGRVLNLSLSTFNDASTSYFHRSIGGYHGAKIKRYQELIENNIQREMMFLGQRLEGNPDSSTGLLFLSTPILNMLDARYVIYNAAAPPIVNNFALGHAWFVKNYRIVENADSEMTGLNYIIPSQTCVIDKRFESQLKGQPTDDPGASIKQTEYNPNHIKYESNASSPQVAVFSEIYYEPDWEMFIDGAKSDYFRCNYVLRGAVIPAGHHTIEFKINPKTYNRWESISRIASFAIIALMLVCVYMFYRGWKNWKPKPAPVPAK